MANTTIQVKRSTTTAVPASLGVGELAISFNSNKLFVGNANSAVVAIGGQYFVDQQNTIFNATNTAQYIANLAFDKANTILTSSYAWTNLVFGYSNSYTNTVGAASNGWANSVGSASNNYAAAVGVAANTYANSTFLSLTGGTINGSLNVSGNLTITGNTTFINVSTLRVSDPLIYLAGNNYTSDIVDIGFIANYVNANGFNVHTGVFRDAGTKEYYVFEGYDKEPDNNVIDPAGNNFTISVLNATLRTSNVILNGANLWSWVNNAYSQANAAPGIANSYAVTVGAAANGWANTKVSSITGTAGQIYSSGGTTPTLNLISTGVTATTYGGATQVPVITIDAYGRVTTASNVSITAMDYAYVNTVGAAANTWANTVVQNLNGSNITSGTVVVSRGGTGNSTFTTNGILYGNGTGPILVTAAGTDGQVLQSDQGVPKFAMLDGGAF